MQSLIADALRMSLAPVALLWSDDRPTDAIQFGEGKWGCVIWHLDAAAKGRTAVVDDKTYGCLGGAVGLGFGNAYDKWPGGIECFYGFLSTGFNEPDRAAAESVHGRRALLHRDGERYVKSPELVEAFVRSLPITQIPKRYVVFKPLSAVDPAHETPETVVFLVHPDQLSALIVLSNYDRGDHENVIAPFAAACQQIGIYPYREARSDRPRSVLGMSDISARKHLNKQLGDHLMSMAVPWRRFLEMEANVEGSFLQTDQWKVLVDRQGS